MSKRFFLSAICVLFSTACGQNWDNWRGPFSNGSTDETGLIEHPDLDRTLIWSVDIDGASSSTPVIRDKKLFLTTSVNQSKQLLGLCLNADSGQLEWSKPIGEAKQNIPRNTLASPSAVVGLDGVYFTFADGTIAKYSPGGEEIWKRNIVDEYGPLSIKFGFSSTPLLYENTLYLPVLRREKTYRKSDWTGAMDSYLLGINAETGQNRFKVTRNTDAVDESTNAYTSCITAEIGGQTQILVHGADNLTGHDPSSGRELWRFHYTIKGFAYGRIVPTPVVDDKRAYCMHPGGVKMVTLDLNKLSKGQPPIVWSYDTLGPDASSPALYKGHLYVIDDQKKKTLTCLEAATGKVCWTGQLDKKSTYFGSITAADDKLYLINEKGLAYIISADPKAFKVLSTLPFEEGGCNASISIADKKIYIRTESKLYCFGNQ